MDNETKKKINERYQRELNHGEFFWPDSIFKDLVVSLAIFIVLILLATFIGVAPEPKADPADTSYLPRPEWYFLFLFKFLALYGQIPLIGKIEWLATVLVPGIGIGLLTLLPLLDKSPYRHYSRRVFALTIMGTVILDIVLLTVMASLPVAPNAQELAASTTLQAIGGLWIPVAVLVLLVGMYLFKRDIYWESTRRSLPVWITVAGSLAMVVMTVVVSARAAAYPKPEEAEVASTLVDQILDEAQQKGTGKWMSQNAFDVGAPIPTVSSKSPALTTTRLMPALEQMRLCRIVAPGWARSVTADRIAVVVEPDRPVPVSSTTNTRSASPSNARPMSKPPDTTRALRSCWLAGCSGSAG